MYENSLRPKSRSGALLEKSGAALEPYTLPSGNRWPPSFAVEWLLEKGAGFCSRTRNFGLIPAPYRGWTHARFVGDEYDDGSRSRANREEQERKQNEAKIKSILKSHGLQVRRYDIS